MLQPLTGLRLADLAGSIRQTVQDNAAQSAQYQQENEAVLAEAAVQSIVDYIEQRAAQLGVSCTVTLATSQDTDGRTVLTGLTLTAQKTEQSERETIESMIVSECGIPKELVTWNWIE